MLIVDDNEFNLLPLTMLLKANHNIQSVKATNGAEAVEIFRRDREKKCCNVHIQLILMDLIMPIMDGFNATISIMDILRRERALKACYDTSRDLL